MSVSDFMAVWNTDGLPLLRCWMLRRWLVAEEEAAATAAGKDVAAFVSSSSSRLPPEEPRVVVLWPLLRLLPSSFLCLLPIVVPLLSLPMVVCVRPSSSLFASSRINLFRARMVSAKDAVAFVAAARFDGRLFRYCCWVCGCTGEGLVPFVPSSLWCGCWCVASSFSGRHRLGEILKVRAEFRKILMQMGFQEMPTSKWVESSFWNFDTLFQPQSHPARDAHDTFFIKEPARTISVPEEYYERVKAMHEVGGSGSIGYRYDFKREEAFKNLLRTHTTAISSQMLYRLANQKGGFTPKKYFSIDRVFRNETMDATPLCEFHQVEGLVADYDLSLGDLIGTIETFFNKIGITQLRFKPAFNPYTEPSMEIFGYHPDLKQWTEIGNSGMFRPEMLAPMGLPKNVRVIAWGLSLERPTMIKYRIKNIRDLFGHKVEMARTRTAPVCRFDAVA